MAGEIVDKGKNYFMNIFQFIVSMGTAFTLASMPVDTTAGVRNGNPEGEKREIVICRGFEAHTCGPMVFIPFYDSPY